MVSRINKYESLTFVIGISLFSAGLWTPVIFVSVSGPFGAACSWSKLVGPAENVEFASGVSGLPETVLPIDLRAEGFGG